MASQHVAAREVVADEVALLSSLVPLAGARLLELGCGAGEFARRLAEQTPVASIMACEVDALQHRRNLEAPGVRKVRFAAGGAESIAAEPASIDGVLMMKSLHHVPMESLDGALDEIARVLKPGGWLYVSEPVYDGEFNDLVKLFHDEGEVRAAAYAALRRAAQRGVLDDEREIAFMAPIAFRDFADFERRLIRATHTHHTLSAAKLAEVRERFESHMGAGGARFVRPMRVNLMRRPRAAS